MALGRNTLMDPPIESLLDKVDSKFTLVALGSTRARQVNAYYNSLGEGLGRVVPPQVTSVSGKPLSIAFEEIAAGKATYTRIDPDAEPAEDDAEVIGEAVPEVTDSISALAALGGVVTDTSELVTELVTELAVDEEPAVADAEDEGPVAG